MENTSIFSQPNTNIGTIGHVAHGKSTLIKAITGKYTSKFKNELERNITIKLGYANSKIFKCTNLQCPSPGCYQSNRGLNVNELICDQCHYSMNIIKHISFIDCPGHEVLMSTMLNGASLMTGALLVVAANETCPQPQTSEHLAAFNSLGIENLIVVQNKIDLVKDQEAKKNYSQIRKFLSSTSLENSPIIPISAQRKCNLDVLLEKIVKNFPEPKFSPFSKLRVSLIRSFDINKPGCKLEDIKGGVVGGSVISGIVSLGNKIEICPGICTKNLTGRWICYSLKSKVSTINSEKNVLENGFPGGLLGIGTNLDPIFTRGDRLAGQVLTHAGKPPEIFDRIIIRYKLLKRLVGAGKNSMEITDIKNNEILLINIGTASTGGKINKIKSNFIQLGLLTPISCDFFSKLTISRRIDRHWRLIGWGIIKKGFNDNVLLL